MRSSHSKRRRFGWLLSSATICGAMLASAPLASASVYTGNPADDGWTSVGNSLNTGTWAADTDGTGIAYSPNSFDIYKSVFTLAGTETSTGNAGDQQYGPGKALSGGAFQVGDTILGVGIVENGSTFPVTAALVKFDQNLTNSYIPATSGAPVFTTDGRSDFDSYATTGDIELTTDSSVKYGANGFIVRNQSGADNEPYNITSALKPMRVIANSSTVGGTFGALNSMEYFLDLTALDRELAIGVYTGTQASPFGATATFDITLEGGTVANPTGPFTAAVVVDQSVVNNSPEPASMGLFALMGGILITRRRRRLA